MLAPEKSLQSCLMSLAAFYKNSFYYYQLTPWKVNNVVFFELTEMQWFPGQRAVAKGGKHTKKSSDLHRWHIFNLCDSIWSVAKATSEAKGAKHQCNLRNLLAETQRVLYFPVKAFKSSRSFMQRWVSQCWSCLPGANGAQAHFPLQWSWNQQLQDHGGLHYSLPPVARTL